MRIYIDTSVVNGLYCNDPEIKTETIRFFKDVRRFEMKRKEPEFMQELHRVRAKLSKEGGMFPKGTPFPFDTLWQRQLFVVLRGLL